MAEFRSVKELEDVEKAVGGSASSSIDEFVWTISVRLTANTPVGSSKASFWIGNRLTGEADCATVEECQGNIYDRDEREREREREATASPNHFAAARTTRSAWQARRSRSGSRPTKCTPRSTSTRRSASRSAPGSAPSMRPTPYAKV